MRGSKYAHLEERIQVDPEDQHLLDKYPWRVQLQHGHYYAIRWVRGRPIRLHQELMGVAGSSTFIDHVNGDGLDNRRCNLRLASQAENQRNRGAQRNNTSGHKGVVFDKRTKKWQAKINVNKKSYSLGYFLTIEEAAEAYRAAAITLHAEFANYEGRRAG